MQRDFAGQRELGERVTARGWVPKVRPTADAELEESFVRAASAWARWRERQVWAGR
jgi:hypothetical protein